MRYFKKVFEKSLIFEYHKTLVDKIPLTKPEIISDRDVLAEAYTHKQQSIYFDFDIERVIGKGEPKKDKKPYLLPELQNIALKLGISIKENNKNINKNTLVKLIKEAFETKK